MRQMYFAFLMLFLLFTSCGSIARLVYGVKKPSGVTYEEVIRFKNEVISKSDPVCFAKMESDADWSVPEPFLFDAEGHAINFRNSENPGCSAPLSNFITNLQPIQKPNKYGLEHMDSFIRSIYQSPCSDSTLVLKEADYHLFVTWATWTGKLVYRQRVCEWLNAAHQNNQVHIAVYLVNLDQIDCK
ncbi:MAG: hypothetical protein ACKPAD_10870 [Bacteroidota bacterium]